MKKDELISNLPKWFEEAGLIYLGIVNLDISQDYLRFQDWLAQGLNADMAFLRNHLEVRAHPERILEDAKSVLIFAYAYKSDSEEKKEPGTIARYARLKDYHKFMRDHAGAVVTKIGQARGIGVDQFRIAIDSAPVLERAFAKKTARGFIGKNTCYIHPQLGSFLLLGEVFTSLELPIDRRADVTPESRTSEGGCGSCKRCQVHCPTGALDQAYTLNAKKCISYWTIEHRGPIPADMWPSLSQYVFGCDICQNVCPYNRKTANPQVHELEAVSSPVDLFFLATMTQQEYEVKFGGTPLTRAKRHGLRRNALIAMFQNRDSRLDKAIEVVRKDTHPDLEETVRQIELQRRLVSDSASQ